MSIDLRPIIRRFQWRLMGWRLQLISWGLDALRRGDVKRIKMLAPDPVIEQLVEQYEREFSAAVVDQALFLQRITMLVVDQKVEEATAEIRAEIEKVNGQYENLFFAALGRALSAWAKMEEALVVIAGMLSKTQLEKIGLIMYSTISFYVRLGIITELFLIEPDYSAMKSQWIKIYEKLKTLSDQRDRLAHHTIYNKDTEGWTSLKPGLFDTRMKSKKYQPMTFEQIMQFSKALREVIEDLTELIKDMKSQKKAAAE